MSTHHKLVYHSELICILLLIIKLYCDIDQDEGHVKTLDDIFTFLDEGLEEPDTFTPEMEVEFHDGNFNIEYVVIYDQDGKILYKDPDYTD